MCYRFYSIKRKERFQKQFFLDDQRKSQLTGNISHGKSMTKAAPVHTHLWRNDQSPDLVGHRPLRLPRGNLGGTKRQKRGKSSLQKRLQQIAGKKETGLQEKTKKSQMQMKKFQTV